MRHDEALEFFQQVNASKIVKSKTNQIDINGRAVYTYPVTDVMNWVTHARTALEGILPNGHAIRKQFGEMLARKGSHPTDETTFEGLRAVFQAATTMFESGRFASIVQGIKAESVSELLDQAEDLVSQQHVAAAAVLAGGALETHLHDLCEHYGLEWAAPGSIGKYDSVIAHARKGDEPITIYGSSDSKQIAAWGGLRNEAAHAPANFKATDQMVRLMVAGVRDFVARTK